MPWGMVSVAWAQPWSPWRQCEHSLHTSHQGLPTGIAGVHAEHNPRGALGISVLETRNPQLQENRSVVQKTPVHALSGRSLSPWCLGIWFSWEGSFCTPSPVDGEGQRPDTRKIWGWDSLREKVRKTRRQVPRGQELGIWGETRWSQGHARSPSFHPNQECPVPQL